MWAWQGGEGLHFSAFSLYIYSAPDMPNFLSQYPMAAGTDYAQQTLASNAIDNEIIRENDYNTIRRVVCYDQPIYDDVHLEDDEWLGLKLGVERSSSPTNVRLMYDEAAILILDNDGGLYTYRAS